MNEYANLEQSIEIAHFEIKLFDWFHFGAKPFECNGLDEDAKDFYLKHNKLPKPCDECYKALIFWDRSFSDENLGNFFKMINSLDFEYDGKLNNGVIVFYFRTKDECLQFVDFLKKKTVEFNVKGIVQWQRACKEFRVFKPELWKNAKEFIPDMQTIKPHKGRQLTF